MTVKYRLSELPSKTTETLKQCMSAYMEIAPQNEPIKSHFPEFVGREKLFRLPDKSYSTKVRIWLWILICLFKPIAGFTRAEFADALMDQFTSGKPTPRRSEDLNTEGTSGQVWCCRFLTKEVSPKHWSITVVTPAPKSTWADYRRQATGRGRARRTISHQQHWETWNNREEENSKLVPSQVKKKNWGYPTYLSAKVLLADKRKDGKRDK